MYLHADNLNDTADIARVIAGFLRTGDVVVLAGEMGSGKTAFTKSAAAALGVTEPVTSPTFNLVHTYAGDNDDERDFALRPVGRRWDARWEKLRGALAGHMVDDWSGL